MISRKKRTRYRNNAIDIAKEQNIPLNPDNWEEVWNILDNHKEPTYVYCMRDELNNYKIGKSVNPMNRLGSVQTGHPYKIAMVAFCKESEYTTESELHKILLPLHIRGEWFKEGEALQNVIQEMYSHMTVKIRTGKPVSQS